MTWQIAFMFSRVEAGFSGRLMELVRTPSIGHFELLGVLATAHFCTVNKYVSFWIRPNHFVGGIPRLKREASLDPNIPTANASRS
jgi:hypothetical protein